MAFAQFPLSNGSNKQNQQETCEKNEKTSNHNYRISDFIIFMLIH